MKVCGHATAFIEDSALQGYAAVTSLVPGQVWAQPRLGASPGAFGPTAMR